MSQDKKYTYVTMPDGRKKRAPLQTGGKSVQEIDHDFETKRMRINPSTLGHDTWYDFLEIEPDYLVNKCKRKGITNPAVLKHVNTWGDRVYNMPPKLKPLTDAQILDDANIKKYEDTINGTYKASVRRVYDSCDLIDNLEEFNKVTCQDSVCNPYPIRRKEDLAAALQVSPSKQKNIYLTQCVNDGYLCQTEEYQEYFVDQFTNIYNGGAGDCLFIAFENYNKLIRECFNGRYIKPYDDISDLEIKKCDFYRIQSGTPATLRLRAEAVRFLDEHRNDRLIGGVPLKVNLATASIEPKESLFSSKEKAAFYTSFISSHPREARILNMSNPANTTKINQVVAIINGPITPESDALLNFLTDQYLKSMSRLSTYAGQYEITALAIIHNVSIEILQLKSSDPTMYERNMGHSIPGANVVYLHHTASTAGSGAHFDVMLPLPEDIVNSNSTSKPYSFKTSKSKASQAQFQPLQLKKFKHASDLDIINDFLLNVSGKLAIKSINDLHEILMRLDDKLKIKALTLLLTTGDVVDNVNDTIAATVILDFIENTLKSLTREDMKKPMHLLLALSRRDKPIDDWLQNVFKTVLNVKFAKIRSTADKFAKTINLDLTLNLTLKDRLEGVFTEFLEDEFTLQETKDPLTIKLFKGVDSFNEDEYTTGIISYFIIAFLDDVYYHLITTEIEQHYLNAIIGIDIDITLENIITLLQKYDQVVELD
jgi:hypothetical protein